MTPPRRVRLTAANALRLALPNARFLIGDGARLPFGDSAFDLVMAASSIEEADDSVAVLGEIGRVLRPGGNLLSRREMPAFAPLFAEATRALGGITGSQPGDAMIAAIK